VSRRRKAPAGFDYQRYLASREWALLREAVKMRASITGDPAYAVCERCNGAPVRATHHLTYERVGRETLDDLLGVCAGCHEYLSGKSEEDPMRILVEEAMDEAERCAREARDCWASTRGVLNAHFRLDAAAYAVRVAQYRMLRWSAAADALPVAITSIWQRQEPDHVEPTLSEDWIRRLAECDKVFVEFPKRRVG